MSSTSFVDIFGYEFFRGDTTGTIRKHGTGIYVRRSFNALPVEVAVPNVAAVYLPGLNLYVVSVYRPPSYSWDQNPTEKAFGGKKLAPNGSRSKNVAPLFLPINCCKHWRGDASVPFN